MGRRGKEGRGLLKRYIIIMLKTGDDE